MLYVLATVLAYVVFLSTALLTDVVPFKNDPVLYGSLGIQSLTSDAIIALDGVQVRW